MALAVGIVSLAGCTYYEVPPGPPPLSTADIIRLSKEGVKPEEIIDQIRATRGVYHMDAKDVVQLHESGVDDKVINYMLDTQKWDIENRAYWRRFPPYYYDPFWSPYYFHWGPGFYW
jgi:hypothetical protein